MEFPMSEIIPFVQCLTVLDPTTLRRLVVIVTAILAMTGRVTMLGISRWASEGGSYRTVQRFFNTKIDWNQVHWFFVKHWFFEETDIYILAGDEVVVTKAGSETHGLDKFYSSLFSRVVPGLSFFVFSVVSTTNRTSYPLMVKQIIRSETDSEPPAAEKAKPKKKGPGRPKGSKNKDKTEVELSPYLQFIQGMLTQLLLLIGIDVRYVVFDGAFGTNYALQMVKRASGGTLHLISKLQYNSALYLPYQGQYRGRGRHKKYGDKLNYDNLPAKYLKKTTTEDGLRTDIYQMKVWHKLFPALLNVVIIVKINLETGARAHVILFSDDLELAYDTLIDYYRLRFQIEFNFRDAKQFWGLEDFMNVKEVPVTNASNLSFLMVNLSQALLIEPRQQNPKFSVNDLKAHFRGVKYVTETLKLLPQMPDPILIQKIIANITLIGSINTS